MRESPSIGSRGYLRVATALTLLAGASGLRADEALRYELTPNFEQGRLHVELTWETGQRRQSALRVSEQVGPIDDVPRMLRNVQISPPYRQENAVWVFGHRPGETVWCSYDVVPGRRAFDDWANTHYPITTADFFHGLGNAFLMVPNSGPEVPAEFEVVLRWKLPAGYKAACSWGAGRTIGARIKATDLRHSVYLAGRLKTTTRNDGGRKISVAIVDQFGFTLDDFADMTSAIIQQQCDFMLETEFPDFVVTAIPVGPELKAGESRLAGSGLYNSFALFVAPGSELDDAVEHLFAHELFHHWNGRLLKAQQPERLVYWFVEGLTDYYSLRILYESGRWDAETYTKWVNKHIREYYFNPAINASNEDIERDYWNQRNTVGEVAYQRGLLLGLRWHRLARKNGVADGIDRLFKSLVNRSRGSGLEVSNHVIRQAGNELLGSWFGAEFDQYVTKAQTIDLPPDALSPELVGKMTEVYAYEVGFDQVESLKDRKVRRLAHGSAAEAAGLREGDPLVAWDLRGDPDVPVRLKVARGGTEHVITYYPRGERRVVMQYRQAD
jgi:predicted metalloprotease with PDZ domain